MGSLQLPFNTAVLPIVDEPHYIITGGREVLHTFPDTLVTHEVLVPSFAG